MSWQFPLVFFEFADQPLRKHSLLFTVSVGLPRTVCEFVSLTLDNILQQYVPRNTVDKWSKSLDLTTIPEVRRILLVVSHFNLSVLATETLSVSLCREIDNVSGAVRTCFDHVLSKLSGFSWERILFLNSACVNMVMQIQVQMKSVFFLWIRQGVLRILKKYSLREIPKTGFMDFGLL